MAKAKKIAVSARMAYVLKETLDQQKPETLRDARHFLAIVDAVAGVFNFTALTQIHRSAVEELERARDAKEQDTATPEQEKLLRLTNAEWFEMLHAELDKQHGASAEITFPIEALVYVTKWLEKQSFNLVGARLMVAFCDLAEQAPEVVIKAKE